MQPNRGVHFSQFFATLAVRVGALGRSMRGRLFGLQIRKSCHKRPPVVLSLLYSFRLSDEWSETEKMPQLYHRTKLKYVR